MLHEFVDLDGVVVLVMPVNSQAARTNQSFIFAVRIDADERWILAMRMAVVRFDEILERLRKLLDVTFN